MPRFINPQIVHVAKQFLKEIADSQSFNIWAFCFMPDHLHLLVQGDNVDSDLKFFVHQFKQRLGYYYSKSWGGSLWQGSYYDHVIRKSESLMAVAKYIFENPVRGRLVDDFRKYPFSGSFVFDWKKL